MHPLCTHDIPIISLAPPLELRQDTTFELRKAGAARTSHQGHHVLHWGWIHLLYDFTYEDEQ